MTTEHEEANESDALPKSVSGTGSIARQPWPQAFGARFLFVYVILYVFPFPAWAIPYIGDAVGTWASKPFEFLATLLGEHLLGMSEMSIASNGSGDTSEAYAFLVLLLLMAAAAAAMWTALSSRRPTPLLSGRLRMIMRWYLGYILLFYGFHKVIPLQFAIPNDFRLTQPLGEFSPMGIAWAFMGSSPAYVIFSGALEVAAGMLLLCRRTSIAGALVAAVILTNIVALNFCYDIPVKLESIHYLLMSLWIALPNAKRIFAAVVLGRAVGPGVEEQPFSRRWMEQLRAPIGTLLVLFFCIHFTVTSIQTYNERSRDDSKLRLSGVYLAEGETIMRWTHFYVSPGGWVRIREPGAEKAALYRIAGTEPDKRRDGVPPDLSTIVLEPYDDSFKRDADAEPLRFSAQLKDEVLTLIPDEEPGVQLRLRRKDTSTYLLRTRGFRWVNEVPYNGRRSGPYVGHLRGAILGKGTPRGLSEELTQKNSNDSGSGFCDARGAAGR